MRDKNDNHGYAPSVSANPVNARQGKLTIGMGIALIISGAALQALNVQSFASQAPPGFASNSSSVTLVATAASLLFLSGVIVTILGTIHYAQSGRAGAGVISPTTAQYTIRAESRTDNSADMPVPTPAFCSSCGAPIVGAGHYCASCGTPTAR